MESVNGRRREFLQYAEDQTLSVHPPNFAYTRIVLGRHRTNGSNPDHCCTHAGFCALEITILQLDVLTMFFLGGTMLPQMYKIGEPDSSS